MPEAVRLHTGMVAGFVYHEGMVGMMVRDPWLEWVTAETRKHHHEARTVPPIRTGTRGPCAPGETKLTVTDSKAGASTTLAYK